MDEIQRLTIEREADWLRVRDNANAALTEAFEARLSSLPGGSRGKEARRLRPALEAQLEAIRDRMWSMTKPNLRVNGFNYEDFVATTEPFDEALDRKVKALHGEAVTWETSVVEKRRVKADEVADLLEDLEERQAYASWRPNADDEARLAAAEEAAKDTQPDVPPPPRHQEVVETFQSVVANLSDLKDNAPKQLERAERVHVVQEEIARLPS